MSPDLSPVKTRPVRFAPCAAGANPTMSTCGRSEPQPGAGLPQYGCPANDLRFVTATCSRQSSSRGQALQTDTAAASSASVVAFAANPATSSGVDATGVCVVAVSPGQPEPGVTG